MADGSIREAVTSGVLDYIREYIRGASSQGERGWRAAQHDEDTLTGHWEGPYRRDGANQSMTPAIGGDGELIIVSFRLETKKRRKKNLRVLMELYRLRLSELVLRSVRFH